MKQLFLIFITCISFSAFSQLKQKMADRLYNQLAYYECVEMYNELANKVIKEHDAQHLDLVRRAAVSNFKLFRMEKALRYFDYLNQQTTLIEQDHEYYIQAYRYIGKYQDAEKQIGVAFSLYPDNIYFKQLKNELGKFNALFADSGLCEIEKTQISSIYGDFAPSFYQNGLVYATKSKNTEVLNGRYKWDNTFYVSMMQSKINTDSSISNGKLLRHQFLDKAHDGPVDFTYDEKKMIITKNIFGKKKNKDVVVLALYFSDFVDGKWTDLMPFEYNNNAYNVGHGCFADSGQTLYFVSDMEGGFGSTDIYRSRLENGKWTKPENLGPKYNTNLKELFPYVANDKIYFASTGHFGLGGLDLFEANLKKGETPRNMGYPINSSADDFGLICDTSGLGGYFSSNRAENKDEIYAFEREEINIQLLVNVFEKYNVDEPVPHQSVMLTNLITQETQEFFTNDKGQLKLVIRPNQNYALATSKQYFNLLKIDTVTSFGLKNNDTLVSNLYLLPTRITIALKIIAEDTRLPLENAEATISRFSIGWDTTLVTNKNGLVMLDVDRNKNYWAHASKKGYIDAEKGFSTGNEDGKIIHLELALKKIKKGEKFKLKNIFYDLNKSTLRPESMASLDKLADFIIKNELKIELSAHTDSRGSSAYNQRLSQARAQSCVDYLLTQGVKSPQIRAHGYGETQLVNHCKNGVKCSEEEHQENRRTEVKILDF